MAEYIERDKAIEAVRSDPMGGLNYKRILTDIPAANVVPVVHGVWLDGYKMQTCSLCKFRGKKSWTFCPHCGAKMDGKGKE